jgi:AraC family transcriptional regulator of adaptative response / DNA-3-methyladenine glycosylase II
MTLDPDVCYLAMTSRDQRFDGRFFAAVVTTGIYCRPVCPAPKPKRRNVRFYSCAAAAEEAGFRPCYRCRPEASPGTPAWIGTSSTVSRALRLIDQGFLDDSNVDELAECLGIGSRHLRRLFLEHLGATPSAVAQTRRVHFAKTLIDGTRLPVTEVAMSAGFSSLRRFNDAFRKTFGMSPTQARRGSARGAAPAGKGGRTANGLILKLSYRTPFDWASILGFLRERAIPGVEHVEGSVYRRTVSVGGAAGVLEVSSATGQPHVRLVLPRAMAPHAAQLAARVRRVFDLQADPEEIASHLSRDPMLQPVIKRSPGLRVPGAWDPFETSVRAIVGQQVTVKAATTIAGRLAERYGEPVECDDVSLKRTFPRPERLARARLNNIGMPAARAGAVRALARAVSSGRLRFDGLSGLDDTVDTLKALDGVGPWTAHYIAMRACDEPDAFPSGDLALRRAMVSKEPALKTERALIERAEAWRPWRAYATMHLWADYATQNGKRG